MKDSERPDIADVVEVVAGNPTPSELAAVVAVLCEAANSNSQPVQNNPNWAKGPRQLRASQNAVDLDWRSDFKGEI
jgi:hypothetical protein